MIRAAALLLLMASPVPALRAHPGHTNPLGLKVTVVDARRAGAQGVRLALRLLNAGAGALEVRSLSVDGAQPIRLPSPARLAPKASVTWQSVDLAFPTARGVPSVFVLHWDLGKGGHGQTLVALEAGS